VGDGKDRALRQLHRFTQRAEGPRRHRLAVTTSDAGIQKAPAVTRRTVHLSCEMMVRPLALSFALSPAHSPSHNPREGLVISLERASEEVTAGQAENQEHAEYAARP
jgi:hypothetical protein